MFAQYKINLSSTKIALKFESTETYNITINKTIIICFGSDDIVYCDKIVKPD